MAYTPYSSSVVTFQSDSTKLVATVSVVAHSPQSVAALQGTNPWMINPGNSSVVTVPQGSIGAVIIGGSVAVSSPANQSVSGEVSVSNFPTTQNVSGSVFATGSVTTLQGTNPWIVQLTSGSVITAGGNSSVQVVGLMPPQSVSGVGIFNIAGSVATTGSVAVLQGTNPWIVAGSSVQVVGVMPAVSIVGGFIRTEDNGASNGDLGLHILGVRNDTVASTVTADKDYTSFALDSAGRFLTKPFAPEESRIYGVASTVNTNPSSLIAAAGAGLRNYITDLWIANTGSVTTLVSFRDSDASILGKTIAPGGGGSNVISLATPMRTHALNSQVEYTAETATSILHVTAFGYQAP